MITHVRHALVGAVALLLVFAMPVIAHAELVESDPPDGGTIETPYTLTATYNEALDPEASSIEVRAGGRGGPEVARDGVSGDDDTMMVVDLPALEPGQYLALWTAVTPDDQAVTRGQIPFTIAASATPAPPTPSPTQTLAPTPTAAPSAGPTTAAPISTPTAAPTASPAASASPAPIDPGVGTGGDAILAVATAAVVIGALALFLLARSRR